MATDSRSTPADPSAESSLGPPQEFRVPRAGDRDLAFKGRKIGSATTVTEDMGPFSGRRGRPCVRDGSRPPLLHYARGSLGR